MPKRNAHKRKITVRNPNKRKSKNKPSPTWDLYRDGITYSLLSKFFVCRERFRLSTVEGWSETGLQSGLEFGSAFHACLEKLLDRAVIGLVRQLREGREHLARCSAGLLGRTPPRR